MTPEEYREALTWLETGINASMEEALWTVYNSKDRSSLVELLEKITEKASACAEYQRNFARIWDEFAGNVGTIIRNGNGTDV